MRVGRAPSGTRRWPGATGPPGLTGTVPEMGLGWQEPPRSSAGPELGLWAQWLAANTGWTPGLPAPGSHRSPRGLTSERVAVAQ